MIVRSPLNFPSIITGGEQEKGRRSGTENMLGIVGIHAALQMLQSQGSFCISHMQKLRLYFEQQLISNIGDVVIHGNGVRVCNTTNVAFLGADAESLLIALDQNGIAASHGSACASGALEPSRILLNMGLPRDIVKSSLRFSFSRFTSREEIDTTLDVLAHLLPHLR